MNRRKSIGLYTYLRKVEFKILVVHFAELLSEHMLTKRILNHFGSRVYF